MKKIGESNRAKSIENTWQKPLGALLYELHWQNNLRHKDIGIQLQIPRPTVTRWFKYFEITSQPGSRFTNFNLLNVGPQKSPKAKPKIKKPFPWKYNINFFKHWSRDMAYVLGFLMADGYVFKNPRGSCYFCFISTDKGLIEKVRNAEKCRTGFLELFSPPEAGVFSMD
ncbi:hypothetical protein HYZ64_00320 [Candidatus Berkelbacteria bacterium]|nr:hypothetical protein [Candidatus Berkelbacteria bacterium]